METTGNFLTQPNKDFPLDCETLDMLQAGAALAAVLGNMAGDKLILTGCALTHGGTRRDAGYLFVRTRDFPDGEILRWEGGDISGGMYLKKEDVAVNALGLEYPKAYTRRTLAPGVGSENFNWEDFRKPKTPDELEARIAKLEGDLATADEKIAAGEPLGVVKMWAGVRVPENYALCDGAALKTDEYPELYAAIGTAFNAARNYNGTPYTTQGGFFRLPDLRGRFIVGYNDLDDEYRKYGNAGGEKKHILAVNEMPSHTHGQNLWQEDSGRWKGGGHNSSPNSTSKHDRTVPFGNTNATGGGAAHENRPPYYVLAYIIKVR